jgi:hypothetical protein
MRLVSVSAPAINYVFSRTGQIAVTDFQRTDHHGGRHCRGVFPVPDVHRRGGYTGCRPLRLRVPDRHHRGRRGNRRLMHQCAHDRLRSRRADGLRRRRPGRRWLCGCPGRPGQHCAQRRDAARQPNKRLLPISQDMRKWPSWREPDHFPCSRCQALLARRHGHARYRFCRGACLACSLVC